jgi:hypothetical protein
VPTAPGAGQGEPTVATAVRPAYSAIPPSTRDSGVFVPAWLLALGGLCLPLLAVAYAVATHRRLRVVRRRVTLRGRSTE